MPSDITARIVAAKQALFGLLYSKLNTEQREAVVTTQGPLLVLAGAGSGKTTVLVNRIGFIVEYGDAYFTHRGAGSADELELLESLRAIAADAPESVDLESVLSSYAVDPCHPSQVLAITFTNKAASEMKARLEAKLGERSAEIWAGTFHSVCVRMLRRHIGKLGYSQSFTIYDTDDSKKLISSVMKEHNLDDKKYTPREVMREISAAKDRLISPEQYMREHGSDFRLNNIGKVYGEYQRRLEQANALDFDDIIVLTVRLLMGHEDVRAYWQGRFKYVLVDEYQDTNFAQYMFMSLMSQSHRNVMVVGDDDQSIYKFRGATIENILSFDRTFEGAKVIKLERNYRSTKNILEAANQVIKNNTGRHEKSLWTTSDEGEKITIRLAPTQNDESSYIVSTIQQLQSEGAKYSDFAVLYRVNAQSANLETVFAKSGVPYRMLGGIRFYERKEIKDIIAYLSVINNPADTVRLRRIINEPSRKIGDTTLAAVEQLAAYHKKTAFEIIEKASEYTALSRAAAKLESFAQIINKLREVSQTEVLPALIEQTIELSGYRTMLEEQGQAEAERLENIKELISNAIGYAERVTEPSLSGFLEETALVADIDNYDREADAVVLMTIHSAKGLEFPVVFIPGMEDGIFPSIQSAYNPEDLEEERRLAYVAITRAKQRLYILHTAQRLLYGKTTCNPLSRFAQEINPELIEVEGLPERKAQRPPIGSPYSAPIKRGLPVNNELNRPYAPGDQGSSTAHRESFKVGDTVSHANFGQGVIVSAKDLVGDTLYEIAFDKVGTKKIMATYARLSRV